MKIILGIQEIYWTVPGKYISCKFRNTRKEMYEIRTYLKIEILITHR